MLGRLPGAHRRMRGFHLVPPLFRPTWPLSAESTRSAGRSTGNAQHRRPRYKGHKDVVATQSTKSTKNPEHREI